jgi:regulatory protein
MDENIIVSIEKNKRGLYVVKFEEESIVVQKDLIVRFGLYKGQKIDFETQRTLKEAVSFYEVYHKALYLLGLRGHFTGQLKVKLLQREYALRVVEDVIQKLTQEGYLNDEALVRSWIEGQSPHMSQLAMQQKLCTYGLDSSLVKQVLHELAPDESAAARELLDKKMRFSAHTMDKQTQEKLIHYLVRKGFTFKCAKNVVENLEGDVSK